MNREEKKFLQSELEKIVTPLKEAVGAAREMTQAISGVRVSEKDFGALQLVWERLEDEVFQAQKAMDQMKLSLPFETRESHELIEEDFDQEDDEDDEGGYEDDEDDSEDDE